MGGGEPLTVLQPEQFNHLRLWTPSLGAEHHAYGQPHALFGTGTPGTYSSTLPFANAARRMQVPNDRGGMILKPYVPVDHAAVVEGVRSMVRGQAHPEDIDPRTLMASQQGITKRGLDFYMRPDNEYERTGRPFADEQQAGNRVPVVYENEHLGVRIIRSGHHRATAALLRGQPLRALVVQGGSGPHSDAAHEWFKGWRK